MYVYDVVAIILSLNWCRQNALWGSYREILESPILSFCRKRDIWVSMDAIRLCRSPTALPIVRILGAEA